MPITCGSLATFTWSALIPIISHKVVNPSYPYLCGGYALFEDQGLSDLDRRDVLRLRAEAPVKNTGKTKRIVKIKDKK
jgi:hypothetical protein